jgi:hypothetical protein
MGHRPSLRWNVLLVPLRCCQQRHLRETRMQPLFPEASCRLPGDRQTNTQIICPVFPWHSHKTDDWLDRQTPTDRQAGRQAEIQRKEARVEVHGRVHPARGDWTIEIQTHGRAPWQIRERKAHSHFGEEGTCVDSIRQRPPWPKIQPLLRLGLRRRWWRLPQPQRQPLVASPRHLVRRRHRHRPRRNGSN